MRIVRLDPSNTRVDREGDLNHLVERRLIAGRAERAVISLLVHGFEGMSDVEDSATTRAKHIPGQIEQAKPGGVQEATDGLLLIEAFVGSKREHIESTELTIAAVANERLDGGNDLGIGRIAQRVEKRFRVAHRIEPLRLDYSQIKTLGSEAWA